MGMMFQVADSFHPRFQDWVAKYGHLVERWNFVFDERLFARFLQESFFKEPEKFQEAIRLYAAGKYFQLLKFGNFIDEEYFNVCFFIIFNDDDPLAKEKGEALAELKELYPKRFWVYSHVSEEVIEEELFKEFWQWCDIM